MEIREITRLLIIISNILRDHECLFKGLNSDECRDCTLANEIDFIIWNLRGKS